MHKENQKEFKIEILTKRKGDKLYIKWKVYDKSFNSWIDTKKRSINEWIFSKTKTCRRKCKKWDLKFAGIDTSRFAKNVDLASLKSEIDKLDIGKLETSLLYLSKLGDVKYEVVKKTEYNKFNIKN